MNNMEDIFIRVTEIGEFIRHNSCERRFKLGFNNREAAKRLPFSERLFNVLDPVLQETGKKREEEWERSLRDGHGFLNINSLLAQQNLSQLGWSEFCAAVELLPKGTNGYAREVELQGTVGGFEIMGRIDFIVVTWENEKVKVRLVECKASRKDRTYHRAQIALYKTIFLKLCDQRPLKIGNTCFDSRDLDCVVARIDEATNEGFPILELPPLELDLISSDIFNLLKKEGHLENIINSDLDSLDFKLEAKCDSCVFNVDCFPEAARLRRLHLIGIDPLEIRTFKANGITNIDELAMLDLDSPVAEAIRGAPGFSGGLDVLVAKAKARQSTLPHGSKGHTNFQVEPLPNRWASQLPAHEISGKRLVRVYLSVDYDYTENRVGALSAHITKSEGLLKTKFKQTPEGFRPDPKVVEENTANKSLSDLKGMDVTRFKTSRWTGRLADDNGSERELIQSFIHDLIDAIATVAATPMAHIHFYVWSRSEINHLIEGCTRGGSDLLAHVNELLGCRESLEQLIFSCVSEEVNNRYALGWTSRGLAAVSSLKWFGDTYHWTRSINEENIDLDRVFAQDIFDFKTDLYLNGSMWSSKDQKGAVKHKFEIRSRFHDSLPAPYWHAVWRTLPDPDDAALPHDLRNAIKRYNQSAHPNRLRSYLIARTHALRWVEEHIKFKNEDIVKVHLNVNELKQFSLNVDNVSRSAVDFLQLEQHIRLSQWLAMHLAAPINRVTMGRTIPLKDLRARNANMLEGDIDLSGYDIDLEELSSRSMLHERSFARLIPHSGDPRTPQTIKQLQRAGSTCVIEDIDWDNGKVRLLVIPMRSGSADQYRLASFTYNAGDSLQYATLDESPSDFVASRVGARLQEVINSPIYRWFDPVSPRLPEQKEPDLGERLNIEKVLCDIRFNQKNKLSDDQVDAVIDGLDTTVQLLQGPPGTGKTQTTAVAIWARALQDLDTGSIVLVVGNTHTSVDNLLQRIVEVEKDVAPAIKNHNLNLPSISVTKVHSTREEEQLPEPIGNLSAASCVRDINRERRSAILVIGGTVGAILKMAKSVGASASFSHGLFADLLVVDEASMMVFPSFLALTSMVSETGKIMLAGDHRQLAPILAHDWEREDRPPVVLYQPFFSAYDSVNSLTVFPGVKESSVRRSPLQYTYRLPPIVRSLIGQLYAKDKIELQGPNKPTSSEEVEGDETLSLLWGEIGLFLVVHSERESRKRNALEAKIIRAIMETSGNLEDDSVAVITPHRAQRTLLKEELSAYKKQAPIVDTVERLQGDQKQTIIISATASDPISIAASVEFILDLNRSNVAFSRVQNRLIVVCAQTLLAHIAPETEHYESAVLWKTLRHICSDKASELEVDGFKVEVFVPSKYHLSLSSQDD